jgi:hypothetical protein
MSELKKEKLGTQTINELKEEIVKDRLYTMNHLAKCKYCRDFFTYAFGIVNNNFHHYADRMFPCSACSSLCWQGPYSAAPRCGPCINKRCEFGLKRSEAEKCGLLNIYDNQLCCCENPNEMDINSDSEDDDDS